MTEVTRAWVAVAPRGLLPVLEPLAAAHSAGASARLVASEDIGDHWRAALRGAASILLVTSPNQSAEAALPGPFVLDEVERRVPAGWLPADDGLRAAILALAEVAARPPQRTPVLLLGGQDIRYRSLLDDLDAGFGASATVYRWDSSRASRQSVLDGLRLGGALALYAGHGTPRGWATYGGIAGSDLHTPEAPLGALVCLTCHGARRPERGPSFAEEMVALGEAGGVLAATGDVPHEVDVALAASLVQAWNAGARTLGELVCHESVPAAAAERYRIVGDPAAPLAGAPGAVEACARVRALHPEDRLPRLPPGWWPPEGGISPDPSAAAHGR